MSIEWRPLDAAEVELLFLASRVRHPTILAPEVESAYAASVRRRGKASRKDYGAGYEDGHEDGYRQAVEDMQRRAQAVGEDAA